MGGDRGIRVDRWAFAGVDLEVQVRDAELSVARLPEYADLGAGLHRAELGVAVEVGVVVTVAVGSGEPDGRTAENVRLRLSDAVNNGQHGNAALADYVDALMPDEMQRKNPRFPASRAMRATPMAEWPVYAPSSRISCANKNAGCSRARFLKARAFLKRPLH